jgi:transcription elongation factor Elf1
MLPGSYTEKIKCPNCNTVQEATVERTIPFYTYVHECVNCQYVILESEWNNGNDYVDASMLTK